MLFVTGYLLVSLFSLSTLRKRKLGKIFQLCWNPMRDLGFALEILISPSTKTKNLEAKKGSSPAPNYLKELTFDFGAIDLGFLGNKYTWAKGKWGNAPIKRRLDRGIASISWRLAYPKASIAHLGAIKSDHTPILLNTNPSEPFAHRPF